MKVVFDTNVVASAKKPNSRRIDRPPTIRYSSGMNIKVVVERGEDGYFVAHCPSLRSCWSQGKTRDEALQNLREAIALYLEPAPGQVVADERHEVVELA